MDHSSSLIVLALVIWATCLSCNCEKISSKSYLKFPTDLSTDFHQNIAAALKKIVIKRPYASIRWFEKAIEEAKTATGIESDRQVYSDLIEIRLGYVDGRLLETILSICAQADNDPGSDLEPWKDYLKNNGRDRYSSFLHRIFKTNDVNTRQNSDIAMEMHRVFAAAFNMKGDIRLLEGKLAHKLSGFDLTTDKTFNAKNMVKEIRRITPNERTEDDFSLFKSYMLGRCERLMAPGNLYKVIIRMDLLRYFRLPTIVRDSAIQLLDEYNRICFALATPNSSDLIRDNLNQRLRLNCFGF